MEAGFDELQHVMFVLERILGSHDELILRYADEPEEWYDGLAALQPGSETVREFIVLLAARDVALEPTADISDIRRVVTVIKDGRVYDPATICRALGIEQCCQGGRDPPRRER